MKIVPVFMLLTAMTVCGCANLRTVSATMPPGLFESADVDTAALYEANLALGGTVSKPSTPQRYARVFADVEYISGAFNSHARWIGTQGNALVEIMIARREVRGVIGISNQTPTQAVVDALLAVSQAADGAPLLAALANPVFTLGPDATLQRLQNVPDLFSTPAALKYLNRSLYQSETGCDRIDC